jgi:hypothetical protein
MHVYNKFKLTESAKSVSELDILKQLSPKCSLQCMFEEKPRTCVVLDEKGVPYI